MTLLTCSAGKAIDSLVPYFSDGVVVGNFPSLVAPWDEISGITRSQTSANSAYGWVIADAGFNPIVMRAIRFSDAADGGVWTLTGSVGADVEDIASATVDGQAYIYIADIGDNAAARTTVNIYRIKEPTITGGSGSLASGVDYETIVCDYPISPLGEGGTARRDAEAIFVDPANGTIYVLSKRTTQVQLFSLAHAAFGGYVGTQTFTSVGDIYQMPSTQNPNSLGNGGRCVAADISPDGTEIVLKNYQTIYHFPRTGTTTTLAALQNGSPTVIKGYVGGKYPSSFPNSEPQGEGLAFSYDGLNLYTASEYSTTFDSGLANNYPLFKYSRLSSAYTEASFQDGVSPTAGYTGTSDTYIDLLNPGTNRGADATIICDWNATGTDERFGLLKFDISTIPATATVVGCDLTLFINTEGSILQVHKMLEAWTEASTRTSLGHTITFDNVVASSAYDVIFGDYALLTTGAGGVDSIVLKMPVATVQAWVSGSLVNNGWVLYQLPTVGGNGFQFRSKQAVTAADRPKLTVRYT